jgi:2,5-diamino-6-(ribosylamino)-4(3H)-pyrimidinone 5'-phosphate reductase
MNKIRNRPYVFICSGMSLDGKISTSQRTQTEIATNDNKEIMYEGRIRADAVMVGGKTLILDDPNLTVKTDERREIRLKIGKTKEPYKVGIISNAENLKLDGDFFNKGETKKIIFTTERTSSKKINELKKVCDVCVFGKERVDLKEALYKLYDLGVKTLMVEGGGELNFSLLKDNLVDEINLKIGNLIIGGRNSPTFVDGEGFDQETAKKVKVIDLIKKENYIILKLKIENY